MLEHMHDPLAVLQEMYRVLKPGGLVGIRSTDLAASLIAPSNATLDKAYNILAQIQAASWWNPFDRAPFPSLITRGGLCKDIGSASSETWGTLQTTQAVASVLIDELMAGNCRNGHSTRLGRHEAQMDNAANALNDWGEHPDAFFAVVWCQGVAWKEEVSNRRSGSSTGVTAWNKAFIADR